MKNNMLKKLTSIVIVASFVFAAITLQTVMAGVATHVVISQVYGGGGNTGAPYKNDFIELYNPTSSDVSLSNWSVQYASATGTSWQVTALSGTIKAYSFYLIQEAAGAGTTMASLPTADAIGTLNMSGTNCKVALVNSTTASTGATPTSYVDFVGIGTATSYEGTAAALAMSNTLSIQRKNNEGNDAVANSGKGNGSDTDVNSDDFTTGAPNPRNSASATQGGATSQNPTITATADATLLAGFENGKVITVTLANADFVATIPQDNITVTGLPTGVTYTIVRTGDKTATITLTGTSTGVSVAPNISIVVLKTAMTNPVPTVDAQTTLTYQLSLPTMAVTADTTLETGAENGKQLTVTLTNGTFVQANVNTTNITIPTYDANNVKSLPNGVTIQSVTYTTPTTAVITLSGNSTGLTTDKTVTVTIKKESIATVADISADLTYKAVISISAARALPANSTASVRGVVSYMVDAKSYTIQDDTAGILLFKATGITGMNIGDKVLASGTIKDYKGLLEFDPFTFTVESTGTAPIPQIITIADLNANPETYESRLVKFESVTLGTVTTTGTKFTSITQGTNTVNIYAITQTVADQLTATGITAGSTADVTCVLSQYTSSTPATSGYQLRVTNATDIVKKVGLTSAPTVNANRYLLDTNPLIQFSTTTTNAQIWYSTYQADGITVVSEGNFLDAPYDAFNPFVGVEANTVVVKAWATMDGMTDSQTMTYTFEKISESTIAQAKATATSVAPYPYACVTGVVTANIGTAKEVYIEDSTGSLVVYLQSTASVGDRINVIGEMKNYHGLMEIAPINTNDIRTLQTGITISNALKMSIVDAKLTENQAKKIAIYGVTLGTITTTGTTTIISSATVTDESGNTITLYNLPTLTGITTGDKINVVGFIHNYDIAQIKVLNASDITAYSYKVIDLSLQNEANIALSQFNYNTPYTLKGNILNKTGENKNPIVVVCTYKQGKLVSTTPTTVIADNASNTPISVNVTITADTQADIVKILVLDSFGNITPLSANLILTKVQ